MASPAIVVLDVKGALLGEKRSLRWKHDGVVIVCQEQLEYLVYCQQTAVSTPSHDGQSEITLPNQLVNGVIA